MKSPHALLKCHAHNRFSPSIALWQHFVGLALPSPTQQRLSSNAAASVQDDADHRLRDEVGKRQHGAEIRRIKTEKGTWWEKKAEASTAHNRMRQLAIRQASSDASGKLLARTRAAFAASEDYIGVVVEPMEGPIPIAEKHLPWCVAKGEWTMAGMDR
jgi:non-canonical poly(A) RNA polymerase PAPD5/7